MALILDGNGLIQGLSAGGLPNGSIDADSLASTLDLSSKTMTFGNVTASGITFPASISASGNPNTLDDYEEGTWTPTLTGGFSSAPSGYTHRVGSYTKIGRYVYFQFDLNPDGATPNASEIKFSGLPFTSSAGSLGFGGATYSYQITSNTNATDLYHIPSSATIVETITSAGTGRLGNASGIDINARIILVGWYIAA
jgi:hypothetical protein